MSTSLNSPEKGITALFSRFADALGSWWTSFDQLCCVTIRNLFFIPFGWGGKPSADETMSAFVGRYAILGFKWALIAEKVINAIVGPGHCRGAIAHDPKD